MSKRLHKPGTFLRLRLPDGSYGYGRCRAFPVAAFYKLKTAEPIDDLDRIAAAEVLFTTAVHKDVHKHWAHIGNRPLEPKLTEPFLQAHQRLSQPEIVTVIADDGRQWEARAEDVAGLERIAVWDADNLEARLLDELEGRENAFALQARVKVPGAGADTAAGSTDKSPPGGAQET